MNWNADELQLLENLISQLEILLGKKMKESIQTEKEIKIIYRCLQLCELTRN